MKLIRLLGYGSGLCLCAALLGCDDGAVTDDEGPDDHHQGDTDGGDDDHGGADGGHSDDDHAKADGGHADDAHGADGGHTDDTHTADGGHTDDTHTADGGHADGGHDTAMTLCQQIASVCHSANIAAELKVPLYGECHQVGHQDKAKACAKRAECLDVCLARLVDAGLDPAGAHK